MNYTYQLEDAFRRRDADALKIIVDKIKNNAAERAKCGRRVQSNNWLFTAVREKRTEIALSLIELGGNLTQGRQLLTVNTALGQKSTGNKTPLMEAIIQGETEVALALLAAGVPCDVISFAGYRNISKKIPRHILPIERAYELNRSEIFYHLALQTRLDHVDLPHHLHQLVEAVQDLAQHRCRIYQFPMHSVKASGHDDKDKKDEKGIGDTGAEVIALALEQYQGDVIDLDLSHNSIGDRALKMLGQVLDSRQKVKSLNIAHNGPISANGLADLFKILPQRPICRLSIAGLRLNRRSTESLSQWLTDNPCLLELDMTDCRLADPHWAILARGLAANTTLHTMSLAGNTIDSISFWPMMHVALQRNDVISTATSWQLIPAQSHVAATEFEDATVQQTILQGVLPFNQVTQPLPNTLEVTSPVSAMDMENHYINLMQQETTRERERQEHNKLIKKYKQSDYFNKSVRCEKSKDSNINSVRLPALPSWFDTRFIHDKTKNRVNSKFIHYKDDTEQAVVSLYLLNDNSLYIDCHQQEVQLTLPDTFELTHCFIMNAAKLHLNCQSTITHSLTIEAKQIQLTSDSRVVTPFFSAQADERIAIEGQVDSLISKLSAPVVTLAEQACITTAACLQVGQSSSNVHEFCNRGTLNNRGDALIFAKNFRNEHQCDTRVRHIVRAEQSYQDSGVGHYPGFCSIETDTADFAGEIHFASVDINARHVAQQSNARWYLAQACQIKASEAFTWHGIVENENDIDKIELTTQVHDSMLLKHHQPKLTLQGPKLTVEEDANLRMQSVDIQIDDCTINGKIDLENPVDEKQPEPTTCHIDSKSIVVNKQLNCNQLNLHARDAKINPTACVLVANGELFVDKLRIDGLMQADNEIIICDKQPALTRSPSRSESQETPNKPDANKTSSLEKKKKKRVEYIDRIACLGKLIAQRLIIKMQNLTGDIKEHVSAPEEKQNEKTASASGEKQDEKVEYIERIVCQGELIAGSLIIETQILVKVDASSVVRTMIADWLCNQLAIGGNYQSDYLQVVANNIQIEKSACIVVDQGNVWANEKSDLYGHLVIGKEMLIRGERFTAYSQSELLSRGALSLATQNTTIAGNLNVDKTLSIFTNNLRWSKTADGAANDIVLDIGKGRLIGKLKAENKLITRMKQKLLVATTAEITTDYWQVAGNISQVTEEITADTDSADTSPTHAGELIYEGEAHAGKVECIHLEKIKIKQGELAADELVMLAKLVSINSSVDTQRCYIKADDVCFSKNSHITSHGSLNVDTGGLFIAGLCHSQRAHLKAERKVVVADTGQVEVDFLDIDAQACDLSGKMVSITPPERRKVVAADDVGKVKFDGGLDIGGQTYELSGKVASVTPPESEKTALVNTSAQDSIIVSTSNDKKSPTASTEKQQEKPLTSCMKLTVTSDIIVNTTASLTSQKIIFEGNRVYNTGRIVAAGNVRFSLDGVCANGLNPELGWRNLSKEGLQNRVEACIKGSRVEVVASAFVNFMQGVYGSQIDIATLAYLNVGIMNGQNISISTLFEADYGLSIGISRDELKKLFNAIRNFDVKQITSSIYQNFSFVQLVNTLKLLFPQIKSCISTLSNLVLIYQNSKQIYKMLMGDESSDEKASHNDAAEPPQSPSQAMDESQNDAAEPTPQSSPQAVDRSQSDAAEPPQSPPQAVDGSPAKKSMTSPRVFIPILLGVKKLAFSCEQPFRLGYNAWQSAPSWQECSVTYFWDKMNINELTTMLRPQVTPLSQLGDALAQTAMTQVFGQSEKHALFSFDGGAKLIGSESVRSFFAHDHSQSATWQSSIECYQGSVGGNRWSHGFNLEGKRIALSGRTKTNNISITAAQIEQLAEGTLSAGSGQIDVGMLDQQGRMALQEVGITIEGQHTLNGQAELQLQDANYRAGSLQQQGNSQVDVARSQVAIGEGGHHLSGSSQFNMAEGSAYDNRGELRLNEHAVLTASQSSMKTNGIEMGGDAKVRLHDTLLDNGEKKIILRDRSEFHMRKEPPVTDETLPDTSMLEEKNVQEMPVEPAMTEEEAAALEEKMLEDMPFTQPVDKQRQTREAMADIEQQVVEDASLRSGDIQTHDQAKLTLDGVTVDVTGSLTHQSSTATEMRDSVIRATGNITLNGPTNLSNNRMMARNELRVSGDDHKVHDQEFYAENVQFLDSQMQTSGTLRVGASDRFDMTRDASITGGMDSKVELTSERGHPVGAIRAGHLALTNNEVNAADVLAGTGSFNQFHIHQRLDLTTNQKVSLYGIGHSHAAVSLTAAAIDTVADIDTQQTLQLWTTHGGINVRNRLTSQQDMLLHSAADIHFSANGAAARQGSLYAHAQGHIVNHGGHVFAGQDMELVTRQGDIVSEAGIFQAGNYLYGHAAGNISGQATETTYRAEHDTRKRVTSAQFLAGAGGMQLKADDKMEFDATICKSEGDNFFTARNGITTTARTDTYLADKQKRGKIKRKYIYTWDTDVSASEFTSTGGGNFFEVTHGEFQSTAAKYSAAQGTRIRAHGDIHMQDLVTERRTEVKKKFIGVKYAHSKDQQQLCRTVDIQDQAGVYLESKQGDIVGQGVKIRAPSLSAVVDDEHAVTFNGQVCDHRFYEKKIGVSVSYPMQQVIRSMQNGGNVAGAMLGELPLTGELQALTQARGAVGQAAGVYNATMAVREGMQQFSQEGLGGMLAAQFVPSARLSLNSSKTDIHYQTLGPGGIDVDQLYVKAGTFEHSVPIKVRDNAIFDVKFINQQATALQHSQKQKNRGISIRVNASGEIDDFGYSESRLSARGTDYAMARLDIGGNLTLVRPVEEWIQNGATADIAGSIVGHVKKLTQIDCQSESRSRGRSLGVNVSRVVTVGKSSTTSRQVREHSAIRAGDASQLSIDLAEQTGAPVLELPGASIAHREMTALTDYAKSSSFQITGDLKAFKKDSSGTAKKDNNTAVRVQFATHDHREMLDPINGRRTTRDKSAVGSLNVPSALFHLKPTTKSSSVADSSESQQAEPTTETEGVVVTVTDAKEIQETPVVEEKPIYSGATLSADTVEYEMDEELSQIRPEHSHSSEHSSNDAQQYPLDYLKLAHEAEARGDEVAANYYFSAHLERSSEEATGKVLMALTRGWVKSTLQVLAHPLDTAESMMYLMVDGMNAVTDSLVGISTEESRLRRRGYVNELAEIKQNFLDANLEERTEMSSEFIGGLINFNALSGLAAKGIRFGAKTVSKARAGLGKNVGLTTRLSGNQIRNYMSDIHKIPREKLIQDIQTLGLKFKGSAPNGDFMVFVDKKGNVRVKIHPPDRVTQYDHIHIYNKQGQDLSSELSVVNSRCKEAHIKIAPDDFSYSQEYYNRMTNGR